MKRLSNILFQEDQNFNNLRKTTMILEQRIANKKVKIKMILDKQLIL